VGELFITVHASGPGGSDPPTTFVVTSQETVPNHSNVLVNPFDFSTFAAARPPGTPEIDVIHVAAIGYDETQQPSQVQIFDVNGVMRNQ